MPKNTAIPRLKFIFDLILFSAIGLAVFWAILFYFYKIKFQCITAYSCRELDKEFINLIGLYE